MKRGGRRWFWIALVAALLAAPNATIVRVAIDSADPYYWIATRFILISIVCLPFVIKARKVFAKSKARRELLKASIALTIAMLSFTFAVYYSQASYVSIITLMTPIIFVTLSARFVGERINSRSVAGITLAAAGAVILVLLPIALQQGGVTFYPLATVFGLIDCIAYAFGIIYLRRADEAGVGTMASIGVSATMTALVASLLLVLYGDFHRIPVDGGYWLAVAYSALIVALLARALNVIVYERLGSTTVSALGYLQTLAAILIPVAVLGEKLSPEMVIGGALILFGVYVVESHKHPHGRHHFIHQHR